MEIYSVHLIVGLVIVMIRSDRMLCVTVSSITKGEQMVPILNALNVNTAVFGNHDFGMCFYSYSVLPHACE